MQNFKEHSKAANKVVETLNSYEFYVVRFEKWGFTLQGEYSSNIAREIKRNYETTSEITDGGFVELSFKLDDVPIRIVLT
tara:strand:+ start:37 stop:276 length:240 start_codon:yes stop_codon:yes gene_type:complete